MKVLFLLCLFSVLMFFDCSSGNKNNSLNNTETAVGNDMQNLFTDKNKVGDVEYAFTAKVIKRGEQNNGIDYQTDVIQISYELKNTGDKNYLVYNRGHFGTNDSVVYVEPQQDGSVEISQKAFREPKDKNCPQRFVAITPNASWLKAKQTVHNQIEVALPLTPKTPFDDCTPSSEMPAKIANIKFCLGISEAADASKVKINDNSFVEGWQDVKEQQLLCSKMVEYK